MKKPVVGVMPLWDEERDSIWMLPGYLEGIEAAGGLGVVLPLTEDRQNAEQLMRMCDGLLFTGGQDVSPQTYGEAPLNGSVECCAERDAMERLFLGLALDADMPVLGICRGLQFINAALGGTLYQDLPVQRPSGINHRQKPPYDEPAHTVTVPGDTPLGRLLKTETLPVNSCHHQAVRETAPCLRGMAVSPDGLTEALYMPGKRFLWAVQWHPEFDHAKNVHSRRLFGAFVASMLPRAAERK